MADLFPPRLVRGRVRHAETVRVIEVGRADAPPTPSPGMGSAPIDQDAIGPRPEPLGVGTIERAIAANESILHHLFGILLIAQHVPRIPDEPISIRRHEGCECVEVTAASSADQIRVGRASGHTGGDPTGAGKVTGRGAGPSSSADRYCDSGDFGAHEGVTFDDSRLVELWVRVRVATAVPAGRTDPSN